MLTYKCYTLCNSHTRHISVLTGGLQPEPLFLLELWNTHPPLPTPCALQPLLLKYLVKSKNAKENWLCGLLSEA